MSDDDERERALRIRWLEKQMEKAGFDVAAERRRALRETWSIIVIVASLVLGAFVAGAVLSSYLGYH